MVSTSTASVVEDLSTKWPIGISKNLYNHEKYLGDEAFYLFIFSAQFQQISSSLHVLIDSVSITNTFHKLGAYQFVDFLIFTTLKLMNI